MRLLEILPEGTTELMCHPGYVDAQLAKSATRLQVSRQAEVEILTDTGIRNLVASQGIRLIWAMDSQLKKPEESPELQA